MRTTAILNLKGGVAKTVTTVNMAAILARDYKARVLLIDADCQCNCTEFFGGTSDKGTLADILRLPDSYPDPVTFCADCIRGTTVDGVNLIPGDDSLMDLDLSKVELGRVRMNVLRQFVEAAKGLDDKGIYDYILIDCPPAFNAASAAALVAADDIIIPIKLDAFSLRGMGNLMRQISNMRKINPRLKLAGVLPTMWYRDAQMQDAEKMPADAGLTVFPHIRRSDKVDRMTWQQRPLLATSPNSAAGVDYRRFVKAYMRGGKGNV